MCQRKAKEDELRRTRRRKMILTGVSDAGLAGVGVERNGAVWRARQTTGRQGDAYWA